MNDNKPISICLKYCGCNMESPMAVAYSLGQMILTPEDKLKLLEFYCKETGNVATPVLKRIVSK